MTKIKRAAAAAAMLLTGACLPTPALTLPEDPKERMATCIAAEALNDAAASPDQSVSMDGMARMMQISLYAATSAEDLDSSATAIQDRAGQLTAGLATQNFASLAAPCREAYPAPYGPEAPLPADPLAAAYVCITAANVLRDTSADHDPAMSRRAEAVAARAAAAGTPLLANISESDNDTAANQAVLATVRLAPIMKTVDACAVRYP